MAALAILSFIIIIPAIVQAAENSLKGQLDKLGDKGGELLIMSDFQVAENIKIPENVTLKFSGAGKLIINSGATLEINGGISAPIALIFQGEGRVSGRPRVDYVVPQWFGAKGDEIADDTQALQKAADLAQFSAKKLLMIPEGRYLVSSTVLMRCNVDAFGTLICNYQSDPKKGDKAYFLQMKRHFPKHQVAIQFVPDSGPLRLDNSAFYGLRAGSSKLPTVKGIHLEGKPDHPVELTPGGTLHYYSWDFMCRAYDYFYGKEESFLITTVRGDITPESLFSYSKTKAEPWSPKKDYPRGSYCEVNGKIYKAVAPSGPNSSTYIRCWGKVRIGPIKPKTEVWITEHELTNDKGQKKKHTMWVWTLFRVEYTPPQVPLTVNNLKIELSCKEQPDVPKVLMNSDVLQIKRSNMIFNNLHVVCNEKNTLPSALVKVMRVVGVTVNNSYFSGATMPGNGYNICNHSSANLMLNNCTSVNSRRGYSGSWGKNVLINGGTYYQIDDHFGYGYTIKNATVYGLSVRMERGKLEGWKFVYDYAFVFDGGNFSIENCRVITPCLLAVRVDTRQFFGNISFRNLTLIWPKRIRLIQNMPVPKKEWVAAEPPRWPTQMLFENIVALDNSMRQNKMEIMILRMDDRFKMQVKNCKGFDSIFIKETGEVDFTDCGFTTPKFYLTEDSKVGFANCTFDGEITGIKAENIRKNFSNLLINGAILPVAGEPLVLVKHDAEDGKSPFGDNVTVVKGGKNGARAYSAGSTKVVSPKRFTIDPNKYYVASAWVKAVGEKPSYALLGFSHPRDGKGRMILARHVNAIPDTFTELTEAAKKGDTSIKIKDGTKWIARKNRVAAFNAKADNSDLPNYDVSLGVKSVEKKNDYWEVVFFSPLTKGYSAGTQVREHFMGGYVYTMNAGVPTEWTLLKSRKVKGSELRMGASGQVMIIANYGRRGKGKQMLFDDLIVEEVDQ